MNNVILSTVAAIQTLPKQAFLEHFVRGIASSQSFSRLVCLGADSLSEKERAQFWLSLHEEGIPVPDEAHRNRPEYLDAVAKAITSRAVDLC